MNHDDIAEAIFGSFDGLTGMMGVVVATLLSHHSAALVITGIGLAIAATVSMAGGDFLSKGSKQRAAVMGLATFVGSVIPVLPFIIIHGWQADGLCACLVLLTAIWISEQRATLGHVSLTLAYVQTFTILVVAVGLTAAVTALLGTAG